MKMKTLCLHKIYRSQVGILQWNFDVHAIKIIIMMIIIIFFSAHLDVNV